MTNSVDPDQTAPIGAVCSGSTLIASILNLSVMLGNYLQQTTSADKFSRRHFQMHFFLGALRVNSLSTSAVCYLVNSLDPDQVLQKIEPDQGTNCLTLGYIVLYLKELFKKNFFEEKSAEDKKHEQLPRKQVWVLILSYTIYKVIFVQYIMPNSCGFEFGGFVCILSIRAVC